MADAHVDVQGFDFHAGNLTTACRAEASSEGGMHADFSRRKILLVLVPWRGEVQRRRLVLEKIRLTTPQNALGSSINETGG
jgi:hypothetical protein